MQKERNTSNAYQISQRAIADLKTAIHMILCDAPEEGMSNAKIGRALGIYQGHIGHEGHMPRTLLSLMENEGVVEQNSETKKWAIKKQVDEQAGQ